MTEDFYDLLDIPPDAPQDEIKDAYREQVRIYHPDLNDDDRAQAQFTAVKKAYDILGDPVERQAYDRLGHETYVAKRTSGLPSPDVWKSSSDTSASDEEDVTATASSTTGSSGAASATASSANSTSSSSSTSTSTGSTTADTGSTAGTAGTSSASGAAGTASSATGGSSATSSTDGGTTHGTTRSRAGTAGSRSDPGRFDDNAAVRWWRRQNFSLPLIWLSVLIYLTGLVQFALANEAGVETLRSELGAVGADPGDIWDALSTSRHGVDSTLEFLAAVEFIAPPLERPLWYAALAGVVGLTLVALLVARAVRNGATWGAVSIDETIVVALAVTATTTLVGGPLLAGAVLMPVLFGVIVRHTRRGPGWKPSYLYLLPVLAPAVGFALAAAGYATLATDLVAFVVLPLVGGLGLPLRATIRKRFGR